MKKVYEMLKEKQDIEFKEFQSKLVPNISKGLIIGVRTPDMKAIAKTVFNSDFKDEFLKDVPHKYYEENIVHMFVVSLIKDFDECAKQIDMFLPYVDCWPVSDQASPNTFKKNHNKLLPFIYKWISSRHVYTIRFGIRMLMNEFLGDDFKDEYLDLVANIKGEDYYLKMMIAWYYATALCKKYDETIKIIEEHRLDSWVHNKTIQKALESFRVTEEHKEYLRSLR